MRVRACREYWLAATGARVRLMVPVDNPLIIANGRSCTIALIAGRYVRIIAEAAASVRQTGAHYTEGIDAAGLRAG